MNWLNLSTQILDSEKFIGAEPTQRGTWLCLLRYCIGQENGGVLNDCLNWPDRKWQQLVRITRDEALSECDLWHWESESLIVWGYPADKESEVREKRNRAKTNGKAGGRPKKTKVGFDAETDKKPTLVISAKAERKGKEREVEREVEKKTRARFNRPTLLEVSAYVSEMGYAIDPEAFFDHYETKGWKVGKEPMRDWQAAVRNWNRRQSEFAASKPSATPTKPAPVKTQAIPFEHYRKASFLKPVPEEGFIDPDIEDPIPF